MFLPCFLAVSITKHILAKRGYTVFAKDITYEITLKEFMADDTSETDKAGKKTK
jgi:hypothetical protein